MSIAEKKPDPKKAQCSPAVDPALLALRQEIITFRRELPRLLAEGHEGRFALVKGDQVVSLWDTFDDAHQAGRDKFGFTPFLAQPVDRRDLGRAFPKEFQVPDAI